MSRAAKRAIKRERRTNRINETRNNSNLRLVQNNEEARREYAELQQNKKYRNLSARNENQAIYIEHLNTGRLTFALGSSGTGKTIIATVFACQQLEKGEIDRIVVTRPMVGCDEDIGFLPGTEDEKYVGWVGPVLEILEMYFGKSLVQTYLKLGKIVLKPLMMMRGSTFRNALVILDEAQNTTVGQMKMFLTRIGEGTKVVVTGDIEQSDLPKGAPNGLEDAHRRLSQNNLVKVVEFTEDDIVRDPLVRAIVKAYRNG